MANTTIHEQQFFNALRDIFVGAEIEGESGFINLMRIKSRYYTDGVFPQLKKDIDLAVAPFPGFREELFDKLYTFFQRYFSESGSIYFRYTPLHQNIYEKVYTDDRDVVLFWKTHMLYYVKTDRVFKSIKVTVDDVDFYFDASNIEHKRANEKRDIVFSFQKVAQDGVLVFDAAYSVRGRVTKIDQILRDLNKENIQVSDETLEKAFRVFEKQSEVDFFINKNARAFLEEQFNLWMYQYLFADKNVWSAERMAQLQALKEIAYKVIGFISQFEDELVKIWSKPKFVRNSHYIITLDHFLKHGRGDLLEVLFAHDGIHAQMKEWFEFGFIEEGIDPQELLRQLTLTDLTNEPLHVKWQNLPLDTRFFPDNEIQLLSIFNDLDDKLDGLLIHSENYQALVTLLEKYKSRIRCIHIDPPYNSETSGFLYVNTYLHASWLSMMENRLSQSLNFLTPDGSILCHIDENEYDNLFELMKSYRFDYIGTAIWDKLNPMMGGKGLAIQHEYIIFSSKEFQKYNVTKSNIIKILEKAQQIFEKNKENIVYANELFRDWMSNQKNFSGGEKAYSFIDEMGRVYRPVSMGWPNPQKPPEKFFIPLIHPKTKKPCPVPSRGWSRTPEKMRELIEKDEIIFGEDETTQPQRKVYLNEDAQKPLNSIISNGKRGKNDIENLGLSFSYCHPVSLYEELIDSGFNDDDDITLDYFAGSGTSAHAVMNLNRKDGGSRKYILVELGEHFSNVIIPRIKKVAFNSKWKDGKPVFEEGESGISQFVKYYELEQYEETLNKVRYKDADLFDDPNQDPYHAYVFLRDLKLLDSLELDQASDEVHFHPERLFPDIDLAETLSHLRGKWIKRITEEFVEFTDGEKMSLVDPDWETLKPMIWWR
ncbi:MAG: site-specific DNA-methyltransferase [Candidatus Atribacteria bacterium]|nr:site-specific DNA-methyltransferase [Candidatus Atribacteria bacterium]